MMNSTLKEKQEEKSLDESDPIGLESTCPFQPQDLIQSHCRTDCEWYSGDNCVVWDIAHVLRQIAATASETHRDMVKER